MRDIDYVVEGTNRYRATVRRHIPKSVSIFVRWSSGLFLMSLGILVLCLTREMLVYLYAPFMIMLGLAAIASAKIDNAVLRLKLKYSAMVSHRFSVELTDEGYLAATASEKAGLPWSMFTDAMEFPDGVLMLQGKYTYHWLPFRSLENSDDSSILYRYVSSRLNREDFVELNEVSQSNELPQDNDANGPQIRLIIVYSKQFWIESLKSTGNWKSSAVASGVSYTIVLLLVALAIFSGVNGNLLIASSLLFVALLGFYERAERKSADDSPISILTAPK